MFRDTEHLWSVIFMAKFCLDCWNKLNETNFPNNRYIFSEDLYPCKMCGKMTHVVVKKNAYYRPHKNNKPS